MFLEMQILTLESRFVILRPANLFSKVENDHVFFQIKDNNTDQKS